MHTDVQVGGYKEKRKNEPRNKPHNIADNVWMDFKNIWSK